MIATMRERLAAKLGNDNANAFRLRLLFKHYDAAGSGLVCARRRRGYGAACLLAVCARALTAAAATSALRTRLTHT